MFIYALVLVAICLKACLETARHILTGRKISNVRGNKIIGGINQASKAAPLIYSFLL